MEVDGWSEAEAEAEMDAFGFHEIWSQLKKFVRQCMEIPVIPSSENRSNHRTNTGVRIGQTTIHLSDIGRCPRRGDGIIVWSRYLRNRMTVTGSK
jgi:hypothetical protein